VITLIILDTRRRMSYEETVFVPVLGDSRGIRGCLGSTLGVREFGQVDNGSCCHVRHAAEGGVPLLRTRK
jgi:hypothetical protein